jgi:hypothetical protein
MQHWCSSHLGGDMAAGTAGKQAGQSPALMSALPLLSLVALHVVRGIYSL